MLASVSLVAVRVCPVLADPRTALSGYVNCSMTPSDEVNDENVPAQFGDATPPSRSDQAENRLVTTTESGREVRDSRPTKMSKRRVCVQGLSSTRPNNSVSTPLIQLVPLHTNAPADGTPSDTVVIRILPITCAPLLRETRSQQMRRATPIRKTAVAVTIHRRRPKNESVSRRCRNNNSYDILRPNSHPSYRGRQKI